MRVSNEDIALGSLRTPVGQLGVTVTRVGLAKVQWVEPDEPLDWSGLPVVTDADRVRPVLDQLDEYFHGGRRDFDLPLDWRHTARLQHSVLHTLYETVGYGASVTYGGLAERSGIGVPARGIGAIMGSNPIPIVVPCHRVLAHDGLGGYSGGAGRTGLEVKRWLLTLEGVLPPTLDWDPDRLVT